LIEVATLPRLPLLQLLLLAPLISTSSRDEAASSSTLPLLFCYNNQRR
jgi:hypothetical protein